MKKILLVDDEESIYILYRQILEDEGYKVYSAFTGTDALQTVKSVSPDLVVLDIYMPGMSGIEVLREIKAMKPNMPVILFSAYPGFKHDLGAWVSDDYIMKSSNPDDLKDAVSQLLSK